MGFHGAGDRIVRVSLLSVMAAALLLACNGEPQTAPPTRLPTATPTNTPFATPMPTAIPATQPSPEASTPTPQPTHTPTHTPIPTHTLTPTPTSTPTPTVDIELDPNAEVGGYWSDGSANVELSATVHNQSGPPVDTPLRIAVTCVQQGAAVQGCGEALEISLPDGYGPASETFTVRVPAGETSVTLGYSSGQSATVVVDVPGRIAGVDRSVWECFSDASNVGTVRQEGEGTGCGAWAEQTILKWDQDSPVRISADGPDSFVAEFKDVIGELAPVFGLRFEWVNAGAGADIAAYVGLTIPEAESQGVFCRNLEVLGCANTTSESGEIDSSEVLVFNRWPQRGVELHEFDEWYRTTFRAAMIHEAVHAFTRMGHRTELLSVMNEAIHQRAELSPMDEALLRLHGHELVEPGMAWPDIERLIVFDEELLDPQQRDPRLAAWALVSDAYAGLRDATSASFRVRSSMPDCSQEFGWADYAVGNLTAAHPYFGWVRVDDGTGTVYALQPGDAAPEYWHESHSGWSRANTGQLASGIPGWRGDLSDPHHLLESILYYADWSEADISTDADGRARLRFTLDMTDTVNHAFARSVDIVLLIDKGTGALSGYTSNWEVPGVACETYQVEAVEGRYGIDFTFPSGVERNSDLIQECDVPSLGRLSGYAQRSGEWLRECGLDPEAEGYARSFRFSLDGWSFVRFELASYDDVALRLLRDDGSGSTVVEMDGAGYLEGGYGIPDEADRLRWGHVALPQGSYVVKAQTRDRVSPGDFTLTVTAQRTPPPPYRFKSISVAGNRTCGLLTDGTPLCWGRRNVEGAGSESPDGRFSAISASVQLVCALREDGTPVCWDFADEGEHTCEQVDSVAISCIPVEQEPVESLPPDRNLGTFATRAVEALPGYWDSTPPAGEKLTSISTGWVHTCGLRQDGTAVCWGSNQHGKSSPPPGERFRAISSGTGHTCALRLNGTPVCWGDDAYGRASPPEGERFVSISAGQDHSCGMREDGTVVCWGTGGFRVCETLPSGSQHCTTVWTFEPLPLSPPENQKFAALSPGDPVCALRSDGSAFCWADGLHGLEPPPNQRLASISSSSMHACALRPDGTATCWGADRFGQSSPPSGIRHTGQEARVPTRLVSISSGAHHTCALDAGGKATCWGPPWWSGRFTDRFTSISSGSRHSCGLRGDGSVVCSGSNDEGQTSPPDGERFTALTSGFAYTCGLRPDGTVACWGGSRTGSPSPPEDERFASISARGAHVCGRRADGSVSCWGDNQSGQASPPQGQKFLSVVSGAWHTCGIQTDGVTVCWGSDDEEQASPPPGERFKSLSAGVSHTCAIRRDGAAVCWGADWFGRASPPENETFIAISCGDEHTCGIRPDGTALCWGSDGLRQSSPRG